MAQTQALEVVANNLANSSTPGYLGQQPTFRALLATSHGVSNVLNAAINNYGTVNGTHLDLSNGNILATGRNLDMAIEGGGFFAVRTPAGVQHTRNGNFEVSPAGQLITLQGDAVLGVEGLPIVLPSGAPTIGPDGTIAVDGAVFGQLRLVEFAPGTSPVAEGFSYYSAPAKAVHPATQSAVRQGMLESANINPVMSVVDLISVQRHFDMMQRALSAYYSDFNRIAAEDLAKV